MRWVEHVTNTDFMETGCEDQRSHLGWALVLPSGHYQNFF